MMKTTIRIGLLPLALAGVAVAGPYSAGSGDPGHTVDAPVPGFVGPHGAGMARLETGPGQFENPENFPNPVIFDWAAEVVDYLRSDGDAGFSDPDLALGPVTGDHFDVVSLGDMTASEISLGYEPGTLTIRFDRPIRNLSGADFVVFENGYVALPYLEDPDAAGVFAELAYVEVSADGVTFERFPATSLTPAPAALGSVFHQYGGLDPTGVHNFAGKHLNSYGQCWGTPFDLADVGLDEITHIRLVDVPGNGAFADAGGNPVYDPWRTFGSGGADIEAVGAISVSVNYETWPQLALLDLADRGAGEDPDNDGLSNLLEYAFGRLPWRADAVDVTALDRLPGGMPSFSFLRDERAADLIYQVEVASSPGGPWLPIAVSSAGSPVEAAPGVSVNISESAASGVASVGVLRRVTVVDSAPPAGRGFYRVKVSRISALIPPP